MTTSDLSRGHRARYHFLSSSHTRSIVVMLVALVLGAPGMASADMDGYTVGINGMACPFCAYGIEQKLSDLDGVESLEIRIRDGEVDLSLSEGAAVTPEAIEVAVDQAGFEVRSIRVQGAGEVRVAPDGTLSVVFNPMVTFMADGFEGDPGTYLIEGELVRRGSAWALVVTSSSAADL